MKIGFALFVVVTELALAVGSARSQSPTPAEIINSIYKPQPNSESGAAFGLDVEERRAYFSKATAALWDKADKQANPGGGDIGAIDFDLTTNSQGADVKSFAITRNKVEAKRASVMVKLELDNWIRNNAEDNLVRYDFVLENGRWIIDDVSSTIDGKRWTLKKLLAINLKK